MLHHGEQVQTLFVHQSWPSAILWLSTVPQFGGTLPIIIIMFLIRTVVHQDTFNAT